MTQETEAKKVDPPSWFTQDTWCTGTLDLSDFGLGTLALRDPPYGMVERMETAQDQHGASSSRGVGWMWKAYVTGGDGTLAEEMPTENAAETKWDTFIRKVNSKVLGRLTVAVMWMNRDDDDSKTSDDEGDDSGN